MPNPAIAQDCVLIELPPDDLSLARPVLATALTLFGAQTEVILFTPGCEPTQERAEQLADLCRDLEGGAPRAQIDLVTPAEAGARTPRVAVRATGDPMNDAVATVLLAGAAFAAEGPGAPPPADPRAAEVAAFLAARDAAIAARDAQAPDSVPVVAVVAQVQSTWGAVETVCQALAADPRVRLEIVAVDSEHEARTTSTANHLTSLGYQPRDVAWLTAQLDDPTSPLATVLFYDPWDGFRPPAARATGVAGSGVRVAYVPYGNNVGAGEHIESSAYDMPMHRLAWRAFARSDRQRQMFADHCAVGDGHVRVLGMPKFDRVVRLADGGTEPLAVPNNRLTVLWNPHFTFGPQGWSTFDRYLLPMIEYAAAHPQMTLVVRPHFRLLRDLPLAGGAAAALLDHLRTAADTLPNVVLDTSPDYLPAFAAADAMVSDLSSLISEFVLTHKPLCYLHKEDGPGTNADAEYFFEGPTATSWAGVQGFLDRLLRESILVRQGTDPAAEARDLLVRRHFTAEDGHAGERIAAEIVDQLLAERSAAPIGGHRDRLAHI